MMENQPKTINMSRVQTITLTSSCQLLHGLPFNTMTDSAENIVW